LSTGIGYQRPIAEVLEPIARAGFRDLEISTAPHHFDYADGAAVDGLRDALARHGLRAHSLHAPFGHDVNITSPEEAIRTYSLDRLEQAAEALQHLGGSLFVLHPGGEDQRWVWDRAARLELSVGGLNRVWGFCRQRGLTLVLETPLPHLIGGQPDDFEHILERLPREGTGVCLDTSHVALGGFLHHYLHRFGHRIVHVQASDNHGVHDDHLVPGEGAIPWHDVIEPLDRAGYRGVFLLEIAGSHDVAVRAVEARAGARRVLEARRPVA
jgi:sugar phosphate isomerase/epimerase